MSKWVAGHALRARLTVATDRQHQVRCACRRDPAERALEMSVSATMALPLVLWLGMAHADRTSSHLWGSYFPFADASLLPLRSLCDQAIEKQHVFLVPASRRLW